MRSPKRIEYHLTQQPLGLRSDLNKGKRIGCSICTVKDPVPKPQTLYAMESLSKKTKKKFYLCAIHYVALAKKIQARENRKRVINPH